MFRAQRLRLEGAPIIPPRPCPKGNAPSPPRVSGEEATPSRQREVQGQELGERAEHGRAEDSRATGGQAIMLGPSITSHQTCIFEDSGGHPLSGRHAYPGESTRTYNKAQQCTQGHTHTEMRSNVPSRHVCTAPCAQPPVRPLLVLLTTGHLIGKVPQRPVPAAIC